MPQQKTYLKKKHQNISPKKKVHKKKVNAEVIEDKKPSVIFNMLHKFVSYWHIWSIIPLIIIIGIIPLIVYAKVVELTPLEERNWTGGTLQLDFFSYYKAYWLIIFTIILVLFCLILVLLKKIHIKKKGFMIPLGIYVLFSMLSTIFALDQEVALRGFMEMFQGLYVLMSYSLLMVIVYHLVEKEFQIKLIIGAFIFLGIVIGLIGFYQYIGQDLFRTPWGLDLILPKVLEPIKDDLTFIFDKYDIYATLGNTNFVGSYAALMIPLAFVLYLYSKKIVFQLFNIIFLSLMLLVGYGSNSRAGIIGIIVSLLMIIIVFRRMFLTKPFKILFPFLLMGSVGYILNVETDGRVINELQSINIFKAIEEAEIYAENRVFITRLEIEDDTLYLETEEEGLVLKWMNNGLWPYNLDGEVLEVLVSGRNVSFVDETYKDFRIRIFEDRNAFTIIVYGRSFDLYKTDEGFKILSNGGFLDQPVVPDRIEALDDYGILFSSRAFIWSRSIPLLKDYFFIGSGPDNYPIAYPQTDIAGKLNYMGIYTIVDKPHNMYIQTGINTGVISLLALLSVFVIYFIQCFRIYIKKFEHHFMHMIGSGLFLGVIAYLSAGIFNDQRVSVAPLFYIMIGLGFTINEMIQKDTSKPLEDNEGLSI
jgi:hypothetical protein